MADLNEVDNMSSELESRLDDLFDENDIRLPDTPDQDTKKHYPLAELKNLILSIDWEITDEVLEKFLQQLQDVKIMYQHDKIVLAYLQILNSLGNYIKINRAKSHPKTFKVLNAVFSSLDNVVLTRDMAEPVKKKMLLAEINRFKNLKAAIARNKSAPQRKPVAVAPKAETPVVELAKEPARVEKPVVEVVKEPVEIDRPVIEDTEEPVVAETPVVEEAQEPVVVDTPVVEITEEPSDDETPVVELTEEPAVAQMPTVERDETPESTVGAPTIQVPEVEKEKLSAAEQSQEPSVVSLSEPSIATLSEAVQEIKNYIHNEIKALKEELRSLRDQ